MYTMRPGGRRAAPVIVLLAFAAGLAPTRLQAQSAVPGEPAGAAASGDSAAAKPAQGTALARPDASDPAAVEVVNLSVQGAFTVPAARVGDSLDYRLSVEWPETGLPVMVLAPDSLDFQGFEVLGQATSHKKVATAQGIGNRSEFVYRLRARTQGNGKASSLKLRYLTGLSREEQSHFVPTAHLDIGAARTPLAQSLWFRLLAGWFALAACGGLAWSAYTVASRRRRARREPEKPDLRPDVLALKGRLRAASLGTPGASKAILEEMEALCIRHLRLEMGEGRPAAASATAVPAKFEPLLDRYLASNPAAEPEWAPLRELFRHARFAGGHKEPHELQDAYRALRKCLRITDEPGEE